MGTQGDPSSLLEALEVGTHCDESSFKHCFLKVREKTLVYSQRMPGIGNG